METLRASQDFVCENTLKMIKFSTGLSHDCVFHDAPESQTGSVISVTMEGGEIKWLL